MHITVVGAGYAGLVTAACLAEFGHDVTCLDIDREVISLLRDGATPIHEPGLDDVLAKARDAGHIRFESDYDGLKLTGESVVVLVVGTPIADDGSVQIEALEAAVTSLTPRLVDGVTVLVKSTVPVGEARRIDERLREARPDIAVTVASNPEFLRQGSAVQDFLEPDRVVIGTTSDGDMERMREMYHPLLVRDVPVVFTSLESAELIKYASNAFLATKLSFINEIADLCEMSGGSIDDVSLGLGLDRRIGPSYLRAGPGFGGSCLPKDTKALLTTSRSYGTSSHIVSAALDANATRVLRMAGRILDAREGDESPIAVLGITFKADTDDIRESPALAIVSQLARRGARVRVFDPAGMKRARAVLGDKVDFAEDEYDAATGAGVVVVATEWSRFADIDLGRLAAVMAGTTVVDLRNLLDREEVADAGLRHLSIGRPDPA